METITGNLELPTEYQEWMDRTLPLDMAFKDYFECEDEVGEECVELIRDIYMQTLGGIYCNLGSMDEDAIDGELTTEQRDWIWDAREWPNELKTLIIERGKQAVNPVHCNICDLDIEAVDADHKMQAGSIEEGHWHGHCPFCGAKLFEKEEVKPNSSQG